eukprot:211551-Pyramimonas_sp.AAC.1
MHWRCGAILRPHLCGPHLGGLSRWGVRRGALSEPQWGPEWGPPGGPQRGTKGARRFPLTRRPPNGFIFSSSSSFPLPPVPAR